MSRVGRKIPDFDHFKFVSKIIARGEKECWTWTGYVEKGRYGRYDIKREDGKFEWFYAHRISYMIFNGELIDGLVIDHECKNKACVNPWHLRQVTTRFNVIDNSTSICSINTKKTHCKNGHEFIAENMPASGKRICIICRRISQRATYVKLPIVPITHCKHGHEYNQENTFLKFGKWKTCLTCRKARDLKRYYAKKKLQVT